MTQRVPFRVRVNGELRGTSHVRVIGATGENLGVLRLADALRAAMKAGLDLVELNPSTDPPVCGIFDFDKYKSRERTAGCGAQRGRVSDEPYKDGA